MPAVPGVVIDHRGPILVVEDDEGTRRLIVSALARQGYEMQEAQSGNDLLEELENLRPSLILLDVTLPGIDGLTLLRLLRERSQIPLIMVTGRDEESDRVLGLELGADDYIVKPFSPRELAARVTAVLRRAAIAGPDERLAFDGLTIDVAKREVAVGGRLVCLTAREFELLVFLAKCPQRAFTRGQLLERVWTSHSSWQRQSTVTEHIRRIRLKIEDDPARPRWLRTVRGVGYCFVHEP